MRYAQICKENLKDVVALQKEFFKDGWNYNQLLSGLENGNLFGEVAYDNQMAVAFITYSCSQDYGEILDVLVAPSYRNKGIASKLMENALRHSKKITNNIFLEVRQSNQSAISLYKRFGFKQISTRKNYYKDGEDALIFEKELSV